MIRVRIKFRKRWRAFWAKARPVLKSGLRGVLRAGYLGLQNAYRFLITRPRQTLLMGASALTFVLVAVIALSFAIPPKSAVAELTQEEFEAQQALLLTPTPSLAPVEEGGAPEDSEPTQVPVESFKLLGEGDTGAVVKDIQLRLMELGYMDSDEPTEYYGSLTASAIKTFQKHNGLSADGLCGQSTYALLLSEEAKIFVMQTGDDGDAVEGVQQRLYELGYLARSNVDGSFGEKTETAVKEFQSKNKLKPVDGKVGNLTLEALYGEDPVANAYTYGDEGDTILYYQKILKKLGYITFTADGRMGRSTVNAVKDFQEANGLTRDGSLGPQTRELLDSGDALPKMIRLGDSGSDVEAVQKRLIKLGYLSSSSATGYYGYKTEEAIKLFQKRNSLTQDGTVGAATLSKLNSSSAKKAPSATPTPKPEATSKATTTPKPAAGSSAGGSTGGSTGGGSTVSDAKGVEKLIAVAQTKIGSKYVRGAKGPNTFDCSGFVYWCLNQAGVKTSYMTSIMWRTSTKFQRITSMSDLKRGDILVFSGSTSSSGHVGIYLGDGKMIDAGSTAGQVRLSTTVLKSGGYWTKHFLMAYRVF